ncbi:phosphotransferase [Microbacteriaceae bacterium VKM Ac-2855]|nr:phosphotransferase [Microbacteriaceae bacterium VKM Ac-2855]
MAEIVDYALRWRVEPTGPAFATMSSELLPGRRDGAPVMLKLARIEEERRGIAVLAGWAGRGAAAVIERDGDAVLMPRATGPRHLARLAATGHDDEATGIICDVLARLHSAPDSGAPAPSLRERTRSLQSSPDRAHPEPGLHRRAAALLGERLNESDPIRLLHGDGHHDNVLDFGNATGPLWLAIDPKGVRGPTVFDHLALFLNPDPATAIAALDRRLSIVADRVGRDDLSAWVLIYAMLSAAWSQEDGTDASAALAVARAAGARAR